MKLTSLLLTVGVVSAFPLQGLLESLFTENLPISIEEQFDSVNADKAEISIWEANERVIKLHKDLVEISSVSFNESEVSTYLEKYFSDKGFTVESFYIDKATGRRNVFVYAGTKRETRILLTSHVDTVPPYFSYSVDGNKISGRGTVDDKASVATQIIAFEELFESGKIQEGDVALLLDVGEEVGGEGAENAYENLKIPWETVIFGEPTDLQLVQAHKGVAGFKLKAIGKALHSSQPELGINAIDLLLDALDDLRKLELPGGEVLGPSTLNIGKIEGGSAANVVPGEASAAVSIRIAVEDSDIIDKLTEEVFAKHERVQVEGYRSHGPIFFDTDIPGYKSAIFTGGTDAYLLRGSFLKYLVGPGTFETIHGPNEFITVEELVKAVEVYKDVVLYKLGN